MDRDLYAELHENETRAYLERIGLPADSSLYREKSQLNRLIFAHQCAVPFENLDITELGLLPSLAVPALFAKIVTRRRGGYCFELNALFYSLLRALGHEAYPCLARVMRDADYPPPPLHRATIVRTGGQLLFCDVGFGGPMPGTALTIVPEQPQISGGDTFCFTGADGGWILHRRTHGLFSPLLSIDARPCLPVDFLPPHEYCALSPASFFRQNRVVNIRRPHGAVTLRNSALTVTENGETTESFVATRRALYDVLEDSFGLSLPLESNG
ncbi:MAG: arylamine N-acetyltransferase [Gracilibacteraceae bacterium]|jgi:N-hydroxyarylamine O-acetyltransferase|nr:arylamine N-acetyltransferase [Gracilibacteraceae bacterium]